MSVLYDVGEQDGVDYLVMEYIEGETLTEKLAKGPLPLELALDYGAQIADGLDRAHRAGIVHRDLKPGNMMLTASGIKLLDFGLAKLVVDARVSDSSDAPTQAQQHTLTGEQTVVGTLRYMAPEQLEGKKADARSDIFAFGATLYEMVTGRKAFEGESNASLITAIMSSEPPAISTVVTAPPSMERVINKCLAKDPDSRWQTARDLHDELRWIAKGGSAGEISRAKPIAHTTRVAWGLTGALLATVVTAIIFWTRTPSDSTPVTRFTITTEGFLPRARGPLLALSRDGRKLAYVSNLDGLQQVHLHDMEQFDDEPVRGTDGANAPFFYRTAPG